MQQASQEWAGIRSNLEARLADAQKLNKNLQSEIERNKSDQTTTERQLRTEIDQMSKRGDSNDNEWKTRYEGLNKVHQDLQGELRQQQTATKEVKQGAIGFLNEMKMLSERSNQSFEREESLVRQIHELDEQVNDWKSRYARAKAQLHTLRTSSVPLPQADLKQLAKARDVIQENGLVKDVHVTGFQVGIDELLRSARIGIPENVLTQVRQIVVSVRQITQDIGESSQDASHQQLAKLKGKVSATANNLITASKNFAASKGLSPVSLLDAAASHLAIAMIELIRLAKIHPSPAGDLVAEEEDNSIAAGSPAAYYGLPHERISYGNESIYSSPGSPNQPTTLNYPAQVEKPGHNRNYSSQNNSGMNGPRGASHTKLGFGIREQDDELEELKVSGPQASAVYSY